MKMLKCIHLFAGLLFAGSALAVAPVAMWDGDFNNTVKGGYTLNLNGNTLAGDESYITITGSNGIYVSGGSLQHSTVLIRYSNLDWSGAESGKAISLLSHKNTQKSEANCTGIAVDNAGKLSGIWCNNIYGNPKGSLTTPTSDDQILGLACTFVTDNPAANPKEGTWAFTQNQDGTYANIYDDGGLRGTGAGKVTTDWSIGGHYGASTGNNIITSAQGMKIYSIAIFDSRLTAAELSAFEWDFSTRMFSDKLASNLESVPAGSYGDIVVPGNGYKATAYSSVTAITPKFGSIDGLIGKPNWTYLLTSTVSGWFKIDALPTGTDATIYGYTREGKTCSMRVAVTPDGKLKIGKGNGANIDTWSTSRGGSVTTDIDVPIGTWFYLTVAGQRKPENNTGDSYMALTVFINGVQKFAQENCFLNDGDNGSSNSFVIGAGVSAAGLYGDTTAVTDTNTIKSWATDEKYVEAASRISSATINGPTKWSELNWSETPEPGDAVKITMEGDSTLTIDDDVRVGDLIFAGNWALTIKGDNALIASSFGIDSFTLASGELSIPDDNSLTSVVVEEGAELTLNVDSAKTLNGISGAGKVIKAGTAELTLNNGATYALDGTILEITRGNVKMNNGNNGDPQAQNATFVIGANGSLNQNGWFNVYGTITFDLAADKTVFNSTIRTYDGTRKLIKKGVGALTFGAAPNGSGFGTIVIEGGAVAFASKEGFIKSGATFDFIQHNKTSATIAGNFTFSDGYTFKFPSDWASGETFLLCSGTLSGIPAGGKIENYVFYLGEASTTADFNLSSNGSVFYNTDVKRISPESDYAISTLNDVDIDDGQTVELTMKAGATLTIDAIAKTATSILCDGILIIDGADGAEPTAEQLAALNFEGVTGKVVKKWLATMGVININLNADNGKFPEGDTSDDGMLAGNTPKSSWINTTGATGTLTEITEWKTLTQESAAVSGMTFEWDANTTWSANATIPIRGGYLDDGKDNGVTLTLAGVPYAMYDVIVYFSTDQGGGLYQPMTVNGIAYTGDKTEKATVLGNAAWGDNAVVASVDEGVNALRVCDLAGEVTIHTAKRNVSTRGCVAAIQIVEVPKKEYRRTYTAEENVDVRTSELNAYIAGGTPYTGPFTLNLNGGKFIADADFVCSALAINSTTDLTIEKANDYTISAEEVAKIAINKLDGDKITYVDIPTIPAMAPAEGKTYRWEGAEPLATLPFAGVAVAGTLEIACPITDADAFAVANSHNSYVFDEGFSLTAQQLIIGNVGGSVQNFTQNGGALTLIREYAGNNTTTEMPLLLAHWNSTCTYNLVGGSITAENGNVMFGRDGKIAMTVGGGDRTATFRARGINKNERQNECSLTIADNGVVQLGVGGIDFGANKKVVLAGGRIEIYDDATIATTEATEVSKNSTIDIAAEKTLILNTTFIGEGVIAITGTGTFNAGPLRDFSKFSIGDGVTLVISENVAEDGEATLTFAGVAPATITLVRVDGTIEMLPIIEGKISYTPSVKGIACWYDFAFNGDRTSVGSVGGSIAKDSGDLGEDPANFHQIPDTDPAEYDAVYTASHPYMGITYPAEWSAAVVATMPDYPNAILMTFGTLDGGTIGLAYGNSLDEVLLVRTTSSAEYETLATMTVPNATTVKHLYVFTKTARQIKVYLDGELWSVYNSTSDISFGNGFQIGSIYGGIGKGLVRFERKANDSQYLPSDYPQEKLLASYIDTLRLYNCVIGPKASAVLSEEFPYISPNGSFERTVSAAKENWVADGAWTKVGDEGTFERPDDGASITITTGPSDTELTINLDVAACEAMTFNGTGKLTLKVVDESWGIVNEGQTKINVPIEIEYGAVDISGAPTTLGENGSICFDYSEFPIELVDEDVTYPVTGLIDEQTEPGRVTMKFPTELGAHKMQLIYENGMYWLKCEVLEDVEFEVPEVANTTVEVLANGEEVTPDENHMVVVPYGASVVVTYVASPGWLFQDKESHSLAQYSIELSDVQEAPNPSIAERLASHIPLLKAEVSIDDVYYLDIGDALDAVHFNEEICLWAAVALGGGYDVPCDMAINLNGFKMSAAEVLSFTIAGGKSLYLYDGYEFAELLGGSLKNIHFNLSDGTIYSYLNLDELVDSEGEPYVKVESDKYGYTYVSANRVSALVDELKTKQPFDLPESKAWLIEAVKSMGYEMVSTMSVEKPSEYRLVISPDEAVNGSWIASFDIANGSATIKIPNAKANFYYGLEYADNPAFENSVKEWAEKGATELSAEAKGANMFYRVLITDKVP